jgi:hypothetical protein
MVRDSEVEKAASSNGGPRVIGRGLHPVVLRCLPSTVAANAIENDPLMRDALISVWWDHPPSDEP